MLTILLLISLKKFDSLLSITLSIHLHISSQINMWVNEHENSSVFFYVTNQALILYIFRFLLSKLERPYESLISINLWSINICSFLFHFCFLKENMATFEHTYIRYRLNISKSNFSSFFLFTLSFALASKENRRSTVVVLI